MSNRLIWLIIILIFILLIFGSYFYLFVYYSGNLKVISNIDNYNIKLHPEKVWLVNINYICEEKTCIIPEIAPTTYYASITKDWYEAIQKNIVIEKNKTTELKIIFEKKISLKKLEEEKNELTNLEKIDLLRKEWIYESYIKNKEWKEIYLKENNNKLELYLWKQLIWNFDIPENKETNIQEIYGSKNYILLKLWEKKYLYSLISKKTYDIDLKINIKYIKTWENDNFIIVTDKWSFIFNKKNKSLEYFNFFNDFVFYKKWYIWIVKKDDSNRKNNLSIENSKNDIVLFYDPNTKEKKILYNLSEKIDKIYIGNNEVILLKESWEKYSLENI